MIDTDQARSSKKFVGLGHITSNSMVHKHRYYKAHVT